MTQIIAAPRAAGAALRQFQRTTAMETTRSLWLRLGARSAEFMDRPIIDVLVCRRVPGDFIFSTGALLPAWFVARHCVLARTAPRPALGFADPEAA